MMSSLLYCVVAALCLMPTDSYGNNNQLTSGRIERALPFPASSTVGLLVALAFPIGLPDREVIFSYNFEANYNSPAPGDLTSLEALQKYNLFDSAGRSQGTVKNGTMVKLSKNKKKKPKKRSLLSRKLVYNMFESKMSAMGLNGRVCLLKTICEVSAIALGDYNGVLGDIVHIIFSPSASRNDRISDDYFEAEDRGYKGDCSVYDGDCPRSLLQYISVLS